MTKAQEYAQQYQGAGDDAKNALARFLTDDGTNVFDPKKIWTDKPPVTAGDVNALLDNGAFGLGWFRLALIRYHRVWDVLGYEGFNRIIIPPLNIGGESIGAWEINTEADPDNSMLELQGRWYDQQRHMNLPGLQNLASAVKAAAFGNGDHSKAADIAADLAGIAGAVPEVWEGRGGDAAKDHLAGFHAHADQQAQYLEAVASALEGLPEVLREIVMHKANFVRSFDSPQCPVAGHAMRLDGAEDPVSTIITVAAESTTWGYLHSKQNEVAIAQFHIEGVGASKGGDDNYKIRTACQNWLKDHFAYAVREAFTALVHQCALADYYIRQAYKPVMDLLDSHDTTPFPQPPGGQNPNQPSNTGPGSAVTGPGAPTTPTSAAPTLPTTPSSLTPTATNPAATQFDPAQILSGIASQASQTVQQGLTQTLQQGLSQIQNVAQQGLGSLGSNLSGLGSQLSGVGSQLTDVKNLPGSKELANLSALGGNLTFTQSPNGTITAKVTGPDGKSQEYSMGIKDGVPFLMPGPDESADPAAGGPSDEKGSHPGGARSSGPGPGPGGASAAGSSAQSLTPAPSGTATPGSVPGHAVEPRAENPSTGSGAGTNAPATPGMPMSGMPHAPGGGGKSAPDSERQPSGIVPPKPLWTTVPGGDGQIPDGPAGPDGPGPELATVGPLEGGASQSPPAGPELATVGPLESVRSAPTGPSQVAATVDSAATRPSTAGVKIEIDTGDAK
ncbi:hypothetical protein C5E45_18285 [Nocardia nova]|uniref:Uncharacterized protein n=1 Tax=Nocardia nova TaxID=37330 RepID=A0A2S6ANH4_9NOCA|nr:hypothetical protein [Nocardia nova]PPJ23348.1 hypothetical protein C5E41_25150 [Nocardia nova]PPJ36764.1 hypothetical protein C5E45_18285 [Nocardia nova]